jgi:hypothetical protein
MHKIPRLIPAWVWIIVVIIIVIICNSCRGGRSLGSGSAGTVIVPKTPQEINERNNRPIFEPLPPVPIIPLESGPITSTNAVKSTPIPTKHPPIKANPIKIDPKPAGELTPFTPTIINNAPPINIKAPPVKLPENNGENIQPVPQIERHLQTTDNKATTPEAVGSSETNAPESFDWVELILNYLVFILFAILIWVIYDIIKRRGSSTVNRLSNTKLKKAPSKKKTTKKKATKKKTASKKKLEEYKKTIPKGLFFDGKSKKPKN